MLVGTQQRKQRNSTKVNLVISAVFHTVIVVSLLYFAAREGLLGKQIKTISLEMVRKEPEKPKVPDKPKEPPKTAVEEVKTIQPKITEVAKIETAPKLTAPPPSSLAPAAVAPPPADIPSFEFEGGKPVLTSSDPVKLYKGLIENALQLNWDRPRDMDSQTNVAEVEVTVDKTGVITGSSWKKKSGQTKWDESVQLAIASTKKITTPPPSNFPSRVLVRFHVDPLEAE